MDSSDACQECDTGTECEAPGVTLDELPLQVRGVSVRGQEIADCG